MTVECGLVFSVGSKLQAYLLIKSTENLRFSIYATVKSLERNRIE